ncbi:hypothetical protein SAMN05518871_10621 [Psychrobacillus sp. OK028]|uniref:hypothetical protein n=1 Tax=Psychrobacillus sp. OK028 TaxID=1884359 RepID=UPI000884C08A|nr:hypothetical protein [Psychrobacillus sp. OK028]SDN56536.1 hypothetical protein SAMN05518871_10621 [Psychrobacillus sp. OK028]
MIELEKRLKKELQQNIQAKIVSSNAWTIPLHTIEVEYKPVKRIKMDVLMKMMLITCQKAKMTSAKQISEILLVEQLFIEDLINIMKRTRLIEIKETVFTLTEKGNQQLEDGIFEEELDALSQNLIYSPSHHIFLQGEIKPALDGEEALNLYRYASEKKARIKWDDAVLIDALEANRMEIGDSELQTVVSEIVSNSELYVDDVPCFEFVLYNKSEDLLYARVWNTFLDQWDETLENELNEKERFVWREKYLKLNK